jgi:hypothetical protein
VRKVTRGSLVDEAASLKDERAVWLQCVGPPRSDAVLAGAGRPDPDPKLSLRPSGVAFTEKATKLVQGSPVHGDARLAPRKPRAH